MKIQHLLILGLPLACNPSHLPDVTRKGFHVIIASDSDLELCGGSAMQMDNFVSQLAATFSISPPINSQRILFNWLSSEDFYLRTPCNTAFSACARRPHTIYSKTAPANHELVHAVAFGFGSPPSFFAEGLAVSYQGLGDGFQALGLEGPDYNVRPLIDMDGADLISTPSGYDLAGAFTSFLISRFGIYKFLTAYSDMDHRTGSEEVDQVFREVFGSSLEDLILSFEASFSSQCGHSYYDAKLLECSAPEILWDGTRLEQHRSIACDQEDVVGPSGQGTTVVLQTLRVPEDGTYELRAVGDFFPDQFSGVSLQRCGKCAPTGGVHASVDSPPQVIPLKMGLYSLRFHGSADEISGIGLSLRRLN